MKVPFMCLVWSGVFVYVSGVVSRVQGKRN